jgi:hypothetical protein
MRKKNLQEKASDRKEYKESVDVLMKELRTFFADADEWGADGYFRSAHLLPAVSEAYYRVKRNKKRVGEKFVGDPSGYDGNWRTSNATSSYVYEQEI